MIKAGLNCAKTKLQAPDFGSMSIGQPFTRAISSHHHSLFQPDRQWFPPVEKTPNFAIVIANNGGQDSDLRGLAKQLRKLPQPVMANRIGAGKVVHQNQVVKADGHKPTLSHKVQRECQAARGSDQTCNQKKSTF